MTPKVWYRLNTGTGEIAQCTIDDSCLVYEDGEIKWVHLPSWGGYKQVFYLSKQFKNKRLLFTNKSDYLCPDSSVLEYVKRQLVVWDLQENIADIESQYERELDDGYTEQADESYEEIEELRLMLSEALEELHRHS